jgi:hypothetical protein
MTISPRVLLACVSFACATAALAVDPPMAIDQGSAPETVKVVSAETASAGTGEQAFSFALIKSDSGQCYAVVPPGGAGVVAGDTYAVVASTDTSDPRRADMQKAHPTCKVVEVVARLAK